MAEWRRQFCVQVLLPVGAGDGPNARCTYEEINRDLANRYGGVTAYVQSPAEGLWQGEGGVEMDRLVVLEVMVDWLDPGAWGDFQMQMERRFGQREIVVRALPIERLIHARGDAPGEDSRWTLIS